jgi:hypothetical protein
MHSGVDKWGKAAILEEGLTANVIQLTAEEMQYIEGRRLNREEACARYDVPPPVVHILDRATFSNITEQMRSMYRDTMAPRLALYESVLDTQLRPDFDPTGTLYASSSSMTSCAATSSSARELRDHDSDRRHDTGRGACAGEPARPRPGHPPPVRQRRDGAARNSCRCEPARPGSRDQAPDRQVDRWGLRRLPHPDGGRLSAAAVSHMREPPRSGASEGNPMKYLPMTLKAVDTAEGTGEFEAILSTSSEDRDGEVIASGAFDPLPESIPVYYQHDWQQKALPIGRGTPFYDEAGSLRIKGYYGSDERAQAVRKAWARV